MIPSRLQSELAAALAVAEDETATPAERAEMLMEIAMGLQSRPRTPDHLAAAVALYERALALCPPEAALGRARITARMATALQSLPEEGTASLERALAAYGRAEPAIAAHGTPQERAELALNRGLVLQSLAGAGRARITDAIAAYQDALRIFDRARYPAEFAILQNNLATAFLSVPATDERAKVREALAVQCFEEGLAAVTLIDHPSEYAMLQNNLGNALQYAGSAHPVENCLRALDAYDEALKVRTPETTPLEYANTIANKANCLMNLPDDPARPEEGNARRMEAARVCYGEAQGIFVRHGEVAKAHAVADALSEIELALPAAAEA